jgi:hypothetical protein
LTLLASVFVPSLTLEIFFKLISHLLNLLWGAWFCSLLDDKEDKQGHSQTWARAIFGVGLSHWVNITS